MAGTLLVMTHDPDILPPSCMAWLISGKGQVLGLTLSGPVWSGIDLGILVGCGFAKVP